MEAAAKLLPNPPGLHARMPPHAEARRADAAVDLASAVPPRPRPWPPLHLAYQFRSSKNRHSIERAVGQEKFCIVAERHCPVARRHALPGSILDAKTARSELPGSLSFRYESQFHTTMRRCIHECGESPDIDSIPVKSCAGR